MRTVGWIVPVGFLITRGDIVVTETCDIPQAVGKEFVLKLFLIRNRLDIAGLDGHCKVTTTLTRVLCGRADKSTELQFLRFCSTECGLGSSDT